MTKPINNSPKSIEERIWCMLTGVIASVHSFAGSVLIKLCRLMARAASHISWSGRFALLSSIAGCLLFDFFVYGAAPVIALGQFTDAQCAELYKIRAFVSLEAFQPFAGLISVLLFLCVLISYWRSRIALFIIKAGSSAFLVCWMFFLFFSLDISARLLNLNLETYDKSMRNAFWFTCIWLWLIIFVPACIFCVMATLSSVKRYYSGLSPIKPCIGDIITSKFNGTSKDPRFTRAVSWSGFYHFAIIFIIPLLALRSCTYDEYRIPKGDGAVAQYIKVVKPPKDKKKKKDYVLNPNSPIIFKIPELDDKRSEEIDKSTEQEYQATQIGPITGKKGKSGWPNGMDDAKIRFIRLEYSGGDWDMGMGKGADYNMLLKMKEYAGFNIAQSTESIKIADLARWKKNKAPPFVYITGMGAINLSNDDVKTIRNYLLVDGGMLFADNGGGSFNNSFRALMQRVCPELKFIDIANDDIIYQQPFYFPNGAPPLWHHSGSRAMGMKYNGRWIVFYHQGDMSVAWRDDGGGVAPEIRERAFKMGANVIAYAFTQYLAGRFESEMGASKAPVKSGKK